MSSIAFIGLGNMGAPMANNLIKAGHQLAVFDLVPGAVNSLADAGARPAASAADAVKGAEIVVTMLPARLARCGEPGCGAGLTVRSARAAAIIITPVSIG